MTPARGLPEFTVPIYHTEIILPFLHYGMICFGFFGAKTKGRALLKDILIHYYYNTDLAKLEL